MSKEIQETPVGSKLATVSLLEFIIDQKLDFLDYPSLEIPLREKFKIIKEGKEAAKGLIDLIIYWETNTGIYDSLEELLNRNFLINYK